jgi:aqualysin 1
MKKTVLVSVALCAGAIAFSLLPSKSSAKNDKFLRSAKAIPNRYIVVMNDDVASDGDETGVGNAVSEIVREHPGKVGKIYSSALKGYSSEMSEEDAARLSQDPRVKFVEEDGEVEAQAVQENATWGLSRIDQRAWSYPYDPNYTYDASGRGVSVYVLDTRVLTTHPDFEGRAVAAFDAYNDSRPVSDCSMHGTHVAGTIASRTFGVAKNATIYSVGVLPCSGAGTDSTVIAGLDWVSRHASRPAVINMSFAGGVSSAEESAIQNLINSGITAVAASGNYNADACSYSPGRMADVINVGATSEADYRDTNSNIGRCVDIFAPGVAITSTWNYTTGETQGIMSGTSTAAPHVAGAAAVYLESNPTASARQVSDYLMAQGTVGVLSNIGNGSPNLLLYSYASGGAPTPTPTPTPTPAPACSGVEFGGYLSSGGSAYQSSSNGFVGRSGTYQGNLVVPTGSNFTLYLEKKGSKRWSSVAVATASGSLQNLSYSGSRGTYRWRVASESGEGSYDLCSVTP